MTSLPAPSTGGASPIPKGTLRLRYCFLGSLPGIPAAADPGAAAAEGSSSIPPSGASGFLRPLRARRLRHTVSVCGLRRRDVYVTRRDTGRVLGLGYNQTRTKRAQGLEYNQTLGLGYDPTFTPLYIVLRVTNTKRLSPPDSGGERGVLLLAALLLLGALLAGRCAVSPLVGGTVLVRLHQHRRASGPRGPHQPPLRARLQRGRPQRS
eukprot:166382-Prorocentrum_minimum.AAC.1